MGGWADRGGDGTAGRTGTRRETWVGVRPTSATTRAAAPRTAIAEQTYCQSVLWIERAHIPLFFVNSSLVSHFCNVSQASVGPVGRSRSSSVRDGRPLPALPERARAGWRLLQCRGAPPPSAMDAASAGRLLVRRVHALIVASLVLYSFSSVGASERTHLSPVDAACALWGWMGQPAFALPSSPVRPHRRTHTRGCALAQTGGAQRRRRTISLHAAEGAHTLTHSARLAKRR